MRPDRPSSGVTDDELRAYVRKSRADQGLPPVIQDEDALNSFAAMIAEALTRAKEADDATAPTPRDADIREAS